MVINKKERYKLLKKNYVINFKRIKKNELNLITI